MMNAQERERAIRGMEQASAAFYVAAVRIGNHPFIEFTGLMNEYIKACRLADEKGIDFSECSTHSGAALPMKEYMVSYVNEKLECIFTGRSVMGGEKLPAQAQERSLPCAPRQSSKRVAAARKREGSL